MYKYKKNKEIETEASASIYHNQYKEASLFKSQK